MNSQKNERDWIFLIVDKLVIGLIVVICSAIGSIVASKIRMMDETNQRHREVVVEKTAEVWKSIVAYRMCLDDISHLNSERFFDKKFKLPANKDWGDRMKVALQNRQKARADFEALVSNNFFYIGPVLTQQAALYVDYLTGYYDQHDQIWYNDYPAGEFALKMLDDTERLLEDARQSLQIAQAD